MTTSIKMLSFCLVLTMLSTFATLSAQTTGLETKAGYVLPTKSFFRGDNAAGKPISTAFSTHLKYSFKFNENTTLGRLYPTVYQGVGVSFNTFFNNKEMGCPLAVYLFQGAPFTHLSPDVTLGYEWNFGASFFWKEYDDNTNQYNTVVGSDINAYIDLGLTLDWHIKGPWNFIAGVDMTHYSNGNTDYPNFGVNIVSGKAGLACSFGSAAGKNPGRQISRQDITHLGCDVVIYGATRRKGINWPDASYLVPGSFGIAGINVSPMWRFNKYFRCGLSSDAQYDESANIKDHLAGTYHTGDLRFHRPPFDEQFAVGLSARAELVMPIFSVNVGIGRNIICKGEDTDCFYQIFALKAFIIHKAFLHIGYQLNNFHRPNNLMIGVGYSF